MSAQMTLDDVRAGDPPRMQTPARHVSRSRRLDVERRLWELLPLGAAHPMSSHDLARALGVGQRTIGSLANDLRMAGYLIGSVHTKGYYRIETAQELEDTVGHILKRINGLRATERALRDAWES